MLQIPLKIIDLQNDSNIFVTKQWKIRISVPMSYIRLFENLAVLEKWYGMESRSVMEPAVLLLVSFPCTIGFELRSCGAVSFASGRRSTVLIFNCALERVLAHN